MAFPTASVLDVFTDASQPRNLSVYDSTNWADYSAIFGGGSQFKTNASNDCDASIGANYWKTISVADVEVFVDVPTIGNNPTRTLDARIQNGNDSSGVTWNAYQLQYTKTTTTFAIIAVVAGGPATLASFTQTLSSGDSFGMSVIGTTITAYYKASGGSWTSLGTATDSSVSGAGNIGMTSSASVTHVHHDNFGGGAPVVAANPIMPNVVDFAVARSTSW